MSLHCRASLAIFLAVVLPAGAWAQELAGFPPLVGASEAFSSDPTSGLALGGYDPVTFFLPEGPRPGRSAFEIVWRGAAWRFASAANRAAFAADPSSFAPRIGGYDAAAASRGRIVEADPLLYAVRDGCLYLFRNDANRAQFLADEALAAKSEEEWVRLEMQLVQ